MNRVFLTGNLTADPEIRQTQSDIPCATFRIGVRRRFANQAGDHESDFIGVVCWRKTAELAGKYLKKGSKVGVVGAIQTRSYDGSDGNRRYVTEVVAEEIEFLSRTENAGGGQGDGVTRMQPPMGEAPAEDNGGFVPDDDDEIPF